MSAKLILFDFDGTLVDSFTAAVEAANRLAPEFGTGRMTLKEARVLRSRNTRELLRTSGIPLRKLPSWIRRMKVEVGKTILQLRPPPGMTEALLRLKDADVRLGVVTSNSRENLDAFLQSQGWQGHFEYTACGSSLFGKNRLIRRLVTQAGIPLNEVFYVGDETRDIEAARRAGVASVAVTWGYNNHDALAQAHPDYILDDPEQLCRLLG